MQKQNHHQWEEKVSIRRVPSATAAVEDSELSVCTAIRAAATLNRLAQGDPQQHQFPS